MERFGGNTIRNGELPKPHSSQSPWGVTGSSFSCLQGTVPCNDTQTTLWEGRGLHVLGLKTPKAPAVGLPALQSQACTPRPFPVCPSAKSIHPDKAGARPRVLLSLHLKDSPLSNLPIVFRNCPELRDLGASINLCGSPTVTGPKVRATVSRRAPEKAPPGSGLRTA